MADLRGVGLLILIVGTFIAMFITNRRVGRPLFWGSALVGGLLAAVATGAQSGRAAGLAMAGSCAALALWLAIAETPFLKIRGRIYAAHYDDSRPDEPDGSAPPHQKPPRRASYDYLHRADIQWWLIAALSVGLAVLVVISSVLLLPFAVAAMFGIALLFAVFAALFGHDDGMFDLPYARGNRIPFLIAAAATLPVAGIPLWGYLAGYRYGRANPGGRGRHGAKAGSTTRPRVEE